MNLLLYKSAHRFICTVWKMLINIQPFSSFWELSILCENYKKKKKKVIGNCCLHGSVYVYLHTFWIPASELSTPIDFRRMAYMQNFGLYSTVYIHVIKPAQTYIKVRNTVDIQKCVSKVIGLKNKIRVSIHNPFLILNLWHLQSKVHLIPLFH